MKDEFISEIAPDNPLLRYSYEDHFIMKMGYTFYYTNKKSQVAPIGKFVYQPDIYTFRAGIETAGNLLYAGSSLSKQKRDPDSQAYKVFGIQYSQYVKLNLDYTYNHSFDRRNALVLHIGAGAAVPYGNSTILPFEKTLLQRRRQQRQRLVGAHTRSRTFQRRQLRKLVYGTVWRHPSRPQHGVPRQAFLGV